jgi:hypothetical protein
MFKRFITTATVIFVVATGTATAAETSQGLKADGLRLTAMAQRYQELHGLTPAGIYADGLRLTAMAQRYQQLHGYTPAALYADGLRWQAMARAYTSRPAVTTGGSGFDWGDAGIGAASVLVLFVCGAAGIVFVRRSRRTKLAL